MKNKEKYEGVIFHTKQGCKFQVTKYVNAFEVHVKFITTGYETIANLQHVKEGAVKDKLSPTVQGVGIVGSESISINRKPIKEYEVWFGMLNRCYSTKPREQNRTYSGCVVSENFKYFPYFKDWCSKQIGFANKGWDLDKDILVKGNKIYSEDTCCFVPNEINKLFTKSNTARGELPIGVCFHKTTKKYEAQITTNSKRLYLGVFNTQEEAFYTYKQAKELHIKEVANKWKDQIDPRVYNALLRYEVEITD